MSTSMTLDRVSNGMVSIFASYSESLPFEDTAFETFSVRSSSMVYSNARQFTVQFLLNAVVISNMNPAQRRKPVESGQRYRWQGRREYRNRPASKPAWRFSGLNLPGSESRARWARKRGTRTGAGNRFSLQFLKLRYHNQDDRKSGGPDETDPVARKNSFRDYKTGPRRSKSRISPSNL